MTCIVTFFSHFGAVRFKKLCDGRGVPAKLMPVPRSLSSSCGTCVRFEEEDGSFAREQAQAPTEETEQIAEALPDGSYRILYRAEES